MTCISHYSGKLINRITIRFFETAFFYCSDPRPLLTRLAEAPGLRYVHRASNLEDVFIKLTGRELRD